MRRYVQQVSKGAEQAAKAQGIAASAAERKKKKEAEEAAAREMAAMFAPAIKQPKPPPGAQRPCAPVALQHASVTAMQRLRCMAGIAALTCADCDLHSDQMFSMPAFATGRCGPKIHRLRTLPRRAVHEGPQVQVQP